MKTEIIALVLLFSLILMLIAAELITLHKLNELETKLNEDADSHTLYESFQQKEKFLVFIFSREKIRELELAFFEYTVSANEENQSRLAEQISYARRQLLLFIN